MRRPGLRQDRLVRPAAADHRRHPHLGHGLRRGRRGLRVRPGDVRDHPLARMRRTPRAGRPSTSTSPPRGSSRATTTPSRSAAPSSAAWRRAGRSPSRSTPSPIATATACPTPPTPAPTPPARATAARGSSRARRASPSPACGSCCSSGPASRAGPRSAPTCRGCGGRGLSQTVRLRRPGVARLTRFGGARARSGAVLDGLRPLAAAGAGLRAVRRARQVRAVPVRLRAYHWDIGCLAPGSWKQPMGCPR